MKTLGLYVGISKQTEVLFLILLGICCTIFDPSLFNLHSNLTKIWELQMDSTKFTETAQIYVKYVTTGVVLVRTFTVHLYLAFYVVMLWPAVFEERPGLMLPWLTIGAIKCLAMGAVSLATAMYICLTYNFAKVACWEFLLAHILDQGPSIYMWFCILSYYHDLKSSSMRYRIRNSSIEFGIAQRQRRAQTILASKQKNDSFEEKRPLISISTIDNLVNELITSKKRGVSRSLDCLLDAMAAEAKKDEILSIQDEAIEEDNTLTVDKKVMKMLKLTPSDIWQARYRKAANLRASSWNKSLDAVESSKKQNRTALEKSHSDDKIIQIRRKKSMNEYFYKDIPSETEMKITFLSNPDMQLESNEASAQSMSMSESVPEPFETTVQMETSLKPLEKKAPEKKVNILSKNNVKNRELTKPSKTVPAQIVPLNTISKSSPASNKPVIISKPKPNYSKLPKRKKEEGSQVNTINEEMLRDITAERNIHSSKPKSKSTTTKTKTVSYNVPTPPEVPYSPFKYDGYTLAYMESQKKAAEEKKAAKRTQ